MLLQRLNEYAQEQMDLPPAGYQPTSIRYCIILHPDGSFVRVDDLADKEHKRGVSFPVPYWRRNGELRPRLFGDDGEWTFGLALHGKRPFRPDYHQAYMEALQECAEQTRELTVWAVWYYLATYTPPTRA